MAGQQKFITTKTGQVVPIDESKGGSGGAKGTASPPHIRGVRSSHDVRSLQHLKELADTKLPPDDDQWEHFYHATRTTAEVNSILATGVRPGSAGKSWLSKDEIRDRGGGFVIVRVPKGEAEEGRDRVEKGVTYREWTVSRHLDSSHVLRGVQSLPLGGGHAIREDKLAAYALKNQGLNDKDVQALPPRYQRWFHMQKPSAAGDAGEQKFITAKTGRVVPIDESKGGGGKGTQENPAEHALTGPELGAMRSYVNYQSGTVNEALRQGTIDSPEWGAAKRTSEALSSAVRKFHTSAPMLVYRGTELKGVDPSKLVGKTYADKGFMSTSTSVHVAQGFARKASGAAHAALLHVHLPRNHPALDVGMDTMAGNSEREMILDKGGSFRVERVEKREFTDGKHARDLYHIHLVPHDASAKADSAPWS